MIHLSVFDTHVYYLELVKAGFTSEQAEVQTKLQTGILSSLTTEKFATTENIEELKAELKRDFATKKDIAELKAELKQDIVELKASTNQDITELRRDMAEFKSEIKQEMTEFKSEIKQEMTGFRSEIKHEMVEFKTEIKKDVFRLENKISTTDNKLNWLLGLTGTFCSVFTLMQILQHLCHLT
jgi:hypothetical protein